MNLFAWHRIILGLYINEMHLCSPASFLFWMEPMNINMIIGRDWNTLSAFQNSALSYLCSHIYQFICLESLDRVFWANSLEKYLLKKLSRHVNDLLTTVVFCIFLCFSKKELNVVWHINVNPFNTFYLQLLITSQE